MAGDISRLGDVGSEAPLGPGADCGQSARAGGAHLFTYPNFMISPGPLASAHAALVTDCFACHVPLHGATSEQCVACHAISDIGLRTTKGAPVASPRARSRRWTNNRAENSHLPTRRRERKMQRFKSAGSARRFLLNSCRRLQHFQRPTPSHLGPNTPRASRCGDGHVADGGRDA